MKSPNDVAPILYMAPLEGVTNCVYRNEYSKSFKGYDYSMAPFISSCKIDSIKNKVLRDLFIQRNDVEFGLIPQILSNAPKDFISLAKAMFELGYEHINWNLGCPSKRVRNKMRGAGLLPYPDKIVEILDEVMPSIPNKLSIKVRLGKNSGEEIFKLLPKLNDFLLEEIVIHPRLGVQMYAGSADVLAFKECLKLTKHKIVYNGDINSLVKFKSLKNCLPDINRWMIGRGGVTNPFLPEQIKGLINDSQQEKLARFIDFHSEIFKAYQQQLSGPGHLNDKMKEIWSYWFKAFEGGDKLLRLIARNKNIAKYSALVDEFFSDKPKLLI